MCGVSVLPWMFGWITATSHIWYLPRACHKDIVLFFRCGWGAKRLGIWSGKQRLALAK